MDINAIIERIIQKAKQDEVFCREIQATRSADHPLIELCRVARTYGIEVYPMDLADAEESAYAAMRRSTNGGGENSPYLSGWRNDAYSMIMEMIG